MSIPHNFTVWDYLVFSVTIAISLGIGIYSALSGGRQRTTEEFIVGNRNLKVFPVTLSLIASYESSIMMLGFPAEMYTYGVQYFWNSVALCIVTIIVAFLMVPTFFEMKMLSVYEYLEARFESRAVRLIGSFLGGMTNLWYMGVVLFGPATALEAVTGFTIWNSVVVTALAAIIYTTLGGIKAVVWADVFQMFIMVAGMLAVIIKGSMAVGGINRVFEISNKGGRTNFFVFDLDPTVRLTFWGVLFGNIFRTMSTALNQSSVQRIATMPTLTKSKLITLLSGPGFVFFGILALLEGLVAYAYFVSIKCDPLEAKIISNPNQIIPYFVMELFHSHPGLPGLFLAALFSASLSTLSSGYASISATVWSDFLKPHMPNVTEFKATVIAKILVVIAGVLSVGVTLLVMQVKGPMTEIRGTLESAFSGPLTGLFLLGGLVSYANYKGAISAVIVASLFAFWKGLGSGFSPDVVATPYLPAGETVNCALNNVTLSRSIYTIYTNSQLLADTTVPNRHATPLTTFYSISYTWISLMAIVITLVVGSLVSCLTNRKRHEVDPRYLMPLRERLCCWVPVPVRCRLQGGNESSHIDRFCDRRKSRKWHECFCKGRFELDDDRESVQSL